MATKVLLWISGVLLAGAALAYVFGGVIQAPQPAGSAEAGPGEHCGGFIQNAPVCTAGYHCQLNTSNPDTGGVCVADENGSSGTPAQQSGSVRVETRIDQGASALGVKVIPLEVVSDSRCPIDVQCIWAGTVVVKAQLQSGLGTAVQEFTLGQAVTTEVETITLIDVSPAKHEGVEVAAGDYRFTFEIAKRQ